MIPKLYHHYHAPWSRWFKTFYLRGRHYHELQVGPWVVYVVRRGVDERVQRQDGLLLPFRASVQRDPFWRP